MTERLTPNDGSAVVVPALGTWRWGPLDLSQATELLSVAVAFGCNLVDTANVYGLMFGGNTFGGAEVLVGSALSRSAELRSQLRIATKAGCTGHPHYDSRAASLTSALDASLKRLQTDRIDLFQIHRPDIFASPHEIASALSMAISSGKVGTVGVSNYSRSQLSSLAAVAEFPIVANQVELSLVEQTPLFNGVVDDAIENDRTVLAWSPLAGGRMFSDRSAPVNVASQIAESHGTTLTHVCLAFLSHIPAKVQPILGSTNPLRLRESMELPSLDLSRAELYSLVAAAGHAVP